MFWKVILTLIFCISFFGLSKEKMTKLLPDYGLCSVDKYRCANENCIKRSWFCDGANDCGDNSDEAYCYTRYVYSDCPYHYQFFRCDDFRCIPEVWQCDGVFDCSDHSDEKHCLDAVEKISGSVSARQLAAKWMLTHRKNVTGGYRWGAHAPRIAIALYLEDEHHFNKDNITINELSYEINIQLLVNMLSESEELMPMNKLALYLHALLITCADPRDFHGMNLVEKLRHQVDNQENHGSPYAILALCNAKDRMTLEDVRKLKYVFEHKERPLWTDTQALALMALSCIRDLPDAPLLDGPYFNSSVITTMSLKLKQGQSKDGGFGNIQTTALVMQALFASGKEDNHWDMDEAVKYLIKSQNVDGSYGNLLNTYFVLPVLHYKSLVNISLSHCKNEFVNDDLSILDDLNSKIGKKIFVKYSLWFGDKVDLARSLEIRILENSTFFDVMKTAKSLDPRYNFKYNTLDSKPYIFTLAEYQDDPEHEKFWFLYRANETGFPTEFINSSPIDVSLKNKEEYIMWYRTGQWIQNLHTLLEETTDT